VASELRFLGTPKGSLTVDLTKTHAFLTSIVPGMIRQRVDKGIDINGAPFAAYSEAWAQTLRDMGENTNVDMRLTGGLMNSVKKLSGKVTGKVLTLTFGPGTGTSPQVTTSTRRASQKAGGGSEGRIAANAKRASLIRRQQRETAKYGVARNTGKAHRTGGRSPPWNLLGSYLQKKRKWLGLSPDQRRDLFTQLLKTGIFKLGGRGTAEGV
jgi:hypothetical protein